MKIAQEEQIDEKRLPETPASAKLKCFQAAKSSLNFQAALIMFGFMQNLLN